MIIKVKYDIYGKLYNCIVMIILLLIVIFVGVLN